jgi:hypothetical protein
MICRKVLLSSLPFWNHRIPNPAKLAFLITQTKESKESQNKKPVHLPQKLTNPNPAVSEKAEK